MINASIMGPTFVTVMMDGRTYTINGDHTNYDAIRQAVGKKDYDTVEKLINVRKAVENFVSGRVVVRGDRVYYGDFEVKGSVVQRILAMLRDGFVAQPMINFLDNLMSNPSKRAVDELYGFLEATALPITDDGCFLAYKKVRNDYRDFYTGTMDNSVGKVLEMPRNQVDEDKDRTCSYGLHFCSFSYLNQYHGGNGRVMIVKINPRDVVSIPSDYNNAKGRAARYEIIGEHEGHESREAFTAPVYNGTSPASPVSAPAAAAPVAAPTQSPALKGYNDGRKDASRGFYHCNGGGYSGTEAATYGEAYNKGYASIVNLNVASVSSTSAATAAPAQAIDDEDDDGEMIDVFDVGYDVAQKHVENGSPYDDTAPTDCDSVDAPDYKAGYAEGWYDAKLASI